MLLGAQWIGCLQRGLDCRPRMFEKRCNAHQPLKDEQLALKERGCHLLGLGARLNNAQIRHCQRASLTRQSAPLLSKQSLAADCLPGEPSIARPVVLHPLGGMREAAEGEDVHAGQLCVR